MNRRRFLLAPLAALLPIPVALAAPTPKAVTIRFPTISDKEVLEIVKQLAGDYRLAP